jgi:hypothetical protein
VIHLTFKAFAKAWEPSATSTRLAAMAADMAAIESYQADMIRWDPERDQPILIEVKCYDSPLTRFSPDHDHAGQLMFERVFAELLTGFHGTVKPVVAYPASYTTGASEDPSRGVRSGEPPWLSWTRGRFESRMRRPPAQTTADVPTARDRTNFFEAIATSYLDWLSVRFGTTQLPSILFEEIASRYLHRLSVRFGTKQLAHDYRDARLRLARSIFKALRLMLARLVSARAHQPKAPAFLLVMLATARHYGHRSEPDHRSLLASVPKPEPPKGAACLVT